MQCATFLITAYSGVRDGGGGGAFIAALAIMPVCYRGDAYPFGNAKVVTKGKEGRREASSFISVFLPLGAHGSSRTSFRAPRRDSSSSARDAASQSLASDPDRHAVCLDHLIRCIDSSRRFEPEARDSKLLEAKYSARSLALGPPTDTRSRNDRSEVAEEKIGPRGTHGLFPRA